MVLFDTLSLIKEVSLAGGRRMSDFGDLKVNELVLNYQRLYFQKNQITLSWILNDSCSEQFEIKGYTVVTGEPALLSQTLDVGKVSSFELAVTDTNIIYKLVALSKAETVCPSTRDIYYRFDGKTILSIM